MDEWIGIDTVVPTPQSALEILMHTFHDDIGLFLFWGVILCIIMYASFNVGVYITNKAVKTINGSRSNKHY